MSVEHIFLISSLFFATSVLYSSVGHGGASGYIAIMGLLALPVEMIRPVALSLNVIVAGLGTYRFAKAGFIELRTAAPLILASTPLAFLGGSTQLPADLYRPLLGVLLLVSAGYLVWRCLSRTSGVLNNAKGVPKLGGTVCGGCIGFVSGLTGIGGGVLLSPLLLIFGWTSVRETSAIAALFILVNSLAGLMGNIITVQHLPQALPIWSATVLVGSWVGTSLGLRIMPVKYLMLFLALAVAISGTKFLIL